MIVIPAIDLLKNKVVRLKRGERKSAVVYSNDPLSVAKRWLGSGAKLIHVVDLDAAFGNGDNMNVIKKIVSCGIDIELGGGIRSFDKAKDLIDSGVKRLVVGSKATDKEFLRKLIGEFGDKIAAGVDTLNGKFMTSGWQEYSGYNTDEFMVYLIDNGIKWIIYTDITKDGTLEGINTEVLRSLKRFKEINFIISGGISSLDDIKKIKDELSFVKGVIIGKSLYEKNIDLEEAIKISQ
ncbi:MAG: hypothetical protein B1H08_01260 [Candidatus Omnitrophica bacterium 4484_171]|nr:MAG: hypothetical protein B1H08_01260 [Candidatus Omnitrophica bacterium 4484_171]